ncbi:SNF2 domain-containing protein CLASSY 3 [Linum perenne]
MRRGLRSKEDELIRQRYEEFKRKQRGEEQGSGSGSAAASASGVCGQSSGRRSSTPENNHSDGSENDGGGDDSSDGSVEFVEEENVGSETVENQATSSDDDVVLLWSSRISDGGGVAEDVGTRGSKTGGHDDSGEKNDESETVQGGKPSEEASSGDDKEAVLSSSETSDGDAEDLDYEVDLPSDAPEDLIGVPEEENLGTGSDSVRVGEELEEPSSYRVEQGKPVVSEIEIEESSSSEEDEAETSRPAGKRESNIGADWWWEEVPKAEEESAELGSSDNPFSVDEQEEEIGNRSRRTDQAKGWNQQCSWEPIRKTRRGLKEIEVVNILADSMFGDAELPVDEDNEEEESAAQQQKEQPCVGKKFRCDEQPTSPPEKSQYEKEIDSLWDEMALALYGTEDTCITPEKVIASSLEEEQNPATLCRQNRHHLILDEEIGVLCKFCSFVQLEIKYYMPPFAENHYRAVNRGSSNNEDNEIPDGLTDYESCTKMGNDQNVIEKGTVWDIIPKIREGLQVHQRDGFEFLWRNIGGDIHIDKLKEPASSSGCVISHAPGTGKTRLAIRFVQTYMKLFPHCRPVIIVPCSMLLSWEAEFETLGVDIPRHYLNDQKLSGKESAAAIKLLDDHRSVQAVRWVKLYSWQKESGILVLSYRLFEELVGKGMRKKRKTEGRNRKGRCVDERIKEVLLDVPGLLVLDEGHTARNDSSLIWRALSNVKTEKRVVLSGTPFQNNFGEFFNTLWLARPNFVDNISSSNHGISRRKRGRKAVNEAREKWLSLTSHLGKDADDWLKVRKLQELRDGISPFVHSYKGNILQEKLPGLRDSVVILQPAKFQEELLANVHGITRTLELDLEKEPLKYLHWEHALSLASVHPYLLLKCKGPFQSADFADLDMLRQLELEPEAGIKTKFLMELIGISRILNEKVLVFSQYLNPLRMIAKQLQVRFKWMEGTDYLSMHGGLNVSQRMSVIKEFNNPSSDAKVLLASTKACSEGISLVGASRVVLLDVVWNPSVARQAISRAYRLGQTKVVHVYNLITSIEEDKFWRQVEKDQMSELVLYSAKGADGCKRVSSQVSQEDRVLEKMFEREDLAAMFKKIIKQPKDSKVV